MNMYFHEWLLAERRQNIQREVEHHRIVASLQSRKRLLHHTVGRLGMLLIVVGTRLRQVERVAAA